MHLKPYIPTDKENSFTEDLEVFTAYLKGRYGEETEIAITKGSYRKCQKCGKTKDIKYFNARDGVRGTYYNTGSCLRCQADEQIKRHRSKLVGSKDRVVFGDTKRCSICGEIKHADSFRKQKNGPSGLSAACNPCRLNRVKVTESNSRSELSDNYVKRLISVRSGTPMRDIPENLVAIWRNQLHIRRLFKNAKS